MCSNRQATEQRRFLATSNPVILQHLRKAEDQIQRRPQFMAGFRQKQPLCNVDLLREFFCREQLIFEQITIGYIVQGTDDRLGGGLLGAHFELSQGSVAAAAPNTALNPQPMTHDFTRNPW